MPPWLDRAAAKRWFDRASGTSGGADHLAREIERRMVSRLAYIKHAPPRILDVGAGAGAGVATLRRAYPHAEVVAVDAAFAQVARAQSGPSLGRRLRALVGTSQERFVCADMTALPFAAASCAMIWSNLALAWSDDFAATLREWHRVLAVGGLLMFSSYGPDTLKELRAAFAAADSAPHVHPFVDMHDVGDALVASGFADPVIDMETLTVTYSAIDALFADLRANGERNALASRRRGLTGRRLWRRMREAYATHAIDARLPATFEIVYGHAWKAAATRVADGRAIIHFDAPRRSQKAN